MVRTERSWRSAFGLSDELQEGPKRVSYRWRARGLYLVLLVGCPGCCHTVLLRERIELLRGERPVLQRKFLSHKETRSATMVALQSFLALSTG